MDDRPGRVLEHGLAHRARVEEVEPLQLYAVRRGVSTDHFMSCIDQLGNKPAKRATGSSDENTHPALSPFVFWSHPAGFAGLVL